MKHIWKVRVHQVDGLFDSYTVEADDDVEARGIAIEHAELSIAEVAFCETEHVLEFIPN